MKPNQWCEISTLISQHRKPIIPGATATDRCYYKIEIVTLMPPTNHLWATKANMDTNQIQITFGPQSQHGYRPGTNYLWAKRANTGTGQIIPSLGHQEQPKNQN